MQWSEVKEPRGKIAIKATEEIKLIQQRRIELERKDQLDQAKQKRRQEKLVEEAKDEVVKRTQIMERDSIIRRHKFKQMLAGRKDDD